MLFNTAHVVVGCGTCWLSFNMIVLVRTIHLLQMYMNEILGKFLYTKIILEPLNG